MSFFTDTDINRINERQEALEAERNKLRDEKHRVDTELFNIENALAILTRRRHELTYGRKPAA